MAKITLNNLDNLENETTAVNVINTNNDTIETAFDNTLSRDGTSPNQMSASIDMNSNRVLNLPTPTSNFEPIRFIDAGSLGTGGTITLNPLPAGGTTGQVLAKNSNTNYDTSWETTGSVISGGSTNQVLAKNSGTNFDLKWVNAVTSVGVSAPTDFTVTGSPVTTTGTLGLAWASTPTGTGSVVRQTSPTLNTPIIAQITNAGNTLTLPTANDTLVGRNTTDILTNKTIATTQLSGAIPASNMPAYAGDVTTIAGGLTTTITANAVTNGQAAKMAAYTLKGNSTGSLANSTDISIPALTQKASPVAGDFIMIADSAASNALKYATVGSVATAGSVSSVGGLTGAVGLGPGITVSGATIQSDPALIGEVRQVAFNRTPINYLACSGAQVSRSTYSLLYAQLVVSSVVTVTIASPAVMTWTGNQFENDDPIFITTSGALPTGLTASTKYYVKGVSGNTFNLSATPGGSAINTSGSQSGTHTGTNAPWEGTVVGDGSTTFTLPGLNGYFTRGIDNAAGNDSHRSFGTSQNHQFQTHLHATNDPGHTHPVGTILVQGAGGVGGGASSPGFTSVTTLSSVTGVSVQAPSTGNTGGETRPMNQTLRYVIRYQ